MNAKAEMCRGFFFLIKKLKLFDLKLRTEDIFNDAALENHFKLSATLYENLSSC